MVTDAADGRPDVRGVHLEEDLEGFITVQLEHHVRTLRGSPRRMPRLDDLSLRGERQAGEVLRRVVGDPPADHDTVAAPATLSVG
jgi:hypothetical protein